MSTTEMTKPLSPSAQVIEDAYFNADGFGYRNALAATLRAAADQVTPEDFDYWHGSAGDYANGYENGQNERNTQVRAELLAIAAELENN